MASFTFDGSVKVAVACNVQLLPQSAWCECARARAWHINLQCF